MRVLECMGEGHLPELIFMQLEVQDTFKSAPAEHGNMEKYADYEGNALVTVDVDCWVRTYTFRAC